MKRWKDFVATEKVCWGKIRHKNWPQKQQDEALVRTNIIERLQKRKVSAWNVFSAKKNQNKTQRDHNCVCVWPVSKSGIKLIPFSCMTEKRGIRSLSKGICTHLSSVRLIRILPSVENTIKDIRNCGLGQERKFSLLAQWPFLDTCFPTMMLFPPPHTL